MSHIRKGKIISSIIILLLSTLLSGCAFKDIDKRTFVVGIGIDPPENGDKKYKLTLKIALPIGSIKQATSPAYAYLSHEGDTISEAIRMMETHTDKVLEFGHAKFIAINEKLLAEEIKDFMDYFIRRGDIQLIAWVAAASPSAEEILKVEPSTESPSTVALFNVFDRNGSESPFIVTTQLFEFRRDFWAKGIDTVIPLIETNEDHSEIIINKSVIVKQQHKPSKLTATETQYYNSLIHNSFGYSYKVEDENLTLLLNVLKYKMKFKIHADKGKPPRADISIKVIASVVESNKVLSLSKMDEYNKMASKDMKKITIDLLKKVQEEGLDPFGFGLRYRTTRINDKNTISDWEEIYPNLEFKIDYVVDLQNLGAIK